MSRARKRSIALIAVAVSVAIVVVAFRYTRHRVSSQKQTAFLARFENMTLCGRQGTFRYIFTDTAMEMGQMAARALIEGRDRRREIFDHRNEMTVIEATSVA